MKLPEQVDHLGINAFQGCIHLKEITVPEGVKVLKHFHGCTNLRTVSIPKSVETIQSDCFSETGLLRAFLEDETGSAFSPAHDAVRLDPGAE